MHIVSVDDIRHKRSLAYFPDVFYLKKLSTSGCSQVKKQYLFAAHCYLMLSVHFSKLNVFAIVA